MKHIALVTGAFFCLAGSFAQKAQKQTPEVWVTDAKKQVLFQRSKLDIKATAITSGLPVINIDDSKRFQQMDGFGGTLTGGSAMVMERMEAKARKALLLQLFDTTGSNIGISYIRISIGASDLDEKTFSYNDLPAGQTDTALTHFSLGYDTLYLLPLLKEILAINPRIKILGSPWSAPVWMKDNGDTRGGSLQVKYQQVYAEYLARYIREMKKEGVVIDAITVQNEPLHPGNNPSMFMTASQQADFVGNHLGPVFEKQGISTKIIVYDHNADRPDYPIAVMDNEKARKYVDGSAFHLYGGTIDALSKVHEAYPNKNLYFTEQWLGAPGNLGKDLAEHVQNLTIGASRNWCKTVLEWNLASDTLYNPHTDRGGCDRCLGVTTIGGNAFSKNPAWYILAHSAKLVRPGSFRIASDELADLKTVAFKRPDGKKVLIVLNTGATLRRFDINDNGKRAVTSLNAGAVATYIW
ncbi:glucosylceramidase [Filimonas lacunae]|uniref:Glucosylceramidase n=1 Tax=Filimonas lacunae TaxID=477680 RepID=A0A173MKP0_9BACT|nr:glycoside hydrolase family 30 beta sandwich domain-containing protein [Filimonas lacunae]BAV08212.1 glucan endo-1,6-beta-glucosidase [Filimonas lacunae]SIT33048.1 glucosylceramidase [Filimonas lacunae]